MCANGLAMHSTINKHPKVSLSFITKKAKVPHGNILSQCRFFSITPLIESLIPWTLFKAYDMDSRNGSSTNIWLI